MYRYFAFDELPEFIRNYLNLNPRLLSRSAASEIKRLLNQQKESKYINVLLAEAWSLLLSNELDQTKITTFISKKLKALDENKTDCHIQSSHNLIRDGKKVGNIAWTSKHLTVKLNTDVVNEAKEQQLRDFLETLIEGKAAIV